MPAVNFKVNWPDGDIIMYYSPSTIIHQFLEANTVYSVDDFDKKVSAALDKASERVKERFGYYCSAATEEKNKIQSKLLLLHSKGISGMVTVLEIG